MPPSSGSRKTPFPTASLLQRPLQVPQQVPRTAVTAVFLDTEKYVAWDCFCNQICKARLVKISTVKIKLWKLYGQTGSCLSLVAMRAIPL